MCLAAAPKQELSKSTGRIRRMDLELAVAVATRKTRRNPLRAVERICQYKVARTSHVMPDNLSGRGADEKTSS